LVDEEEIWAVFVVEEISEREEWLSETAGAEEGAASFRDSERGRL